MIHDLIMAAAGVVTGPTYPAIASTATSTSSGTTSHAVTMPSGLSSGDLAITVFRSSGVITTFTPATGWTATALSDARQVVVYRVASGSEGASVTHTTDVSVSSNHVTFRINNWNGTLVSGFAIASATGSSNTPDAPNLASGFSAGTTNLWLVALAARSGSSNSLTAYPSGYTLSQTVSGSSGYAAMAAKQATSSTEDPGTASQSNNTTWSAFTIAVRGTT